MGNLLHQEEHVANEMNPEVLKHLAKLGAQARLAQIDMERKAILTAFPDLAGPGAARRRGRRAPAQKSATPAAAPRRRRTMSAAERKEVSERMTRYWAARRKEKAAKAKR